MLYQPICPQGPLLHVNWFFLSILKSINKDESLISKQPDILKVENYPKFLDNSATNMADYFLTPNKESMFEVFKFNIEYAIKKDAPVFIKYYLM